MFFSSFLIVLQLRIDKILLYLYHICLKSTNSKREEVTHYIEQKKNVCEMHFSLDEIWRD